MFTEPSVKNAVDLQAIMAAMSETPVGATITFAQLTEAIGAPIKPRRFLVQRAIQKLSKQNGAIFVSVKNIGYQRLPPQDSHLIGAACRRTIHRKADRTGKKIIRALESANDMPRDAMMRANREVAMLGLIAHATTEKAFDASVTEIESPKPIAKVMADMLAKISPSPPSSDA